MSSLLQRMNEEHKARLMRLNGKACGDPSDVTDLRERIDHQAAVIRGLRQTIASQRELILKFTDQGEYQAPRLAEIMTVVARNFGVATRSISGEHRNASLVLPRQVVYYLGHKYGHSYPKIGRACDKDHTTVLYGVKKISDRLAADPKLAEQIVVIEFEIDQLVTARVKAAKAALS